jgi:hypothetical protein
LKEKIAAYLKPSASLLGFVFVVALPGHACCTSSGEGLRLGDERRGRRNCVFLFWDVNFVKVIRTAPVKGQRAACTLFGTGT